MNNNNSLEFNLLTSDFYNDYSTCKEILQKKGRPYVICIVQIENISFAIPIRSKITHKYGIKTIGNRGIDFTKAVIITKKSYVSTKKALINKKEYLILSNKKYLIEKKLKNYINDYKKALRDTKDRKNLLLVKHSSLQYFHTELKIQ